MDRIYTIGEAAKIVNATEETLRHYDRIGVVKPSKRNIANKYRYYSDDDIAKLKAIHVLKCMDMSLAEIKEILEHDDFTHIFEDQRAKN